MGKTENGSHKGVVMEVGRSCLHRPSRGRKVPHFANLSYQLLSSMGVTIYLSQQQVRLGKSIFSKSSPLPLTASAVEKVLLTLVLEPSVLRTLTCCTGVDELVISKVLFNQDPLLQQIQKKNSTRALTDTVKSPLSCSAELAAQALLDVVM